MEEISSIVDMILPHWPFIMVTLIFTVVGQVTSLRIFTKERAYLPRKGKFYQFWDAQWFWWWGRETLPLQPIFTGLLLGFVWRNPEGADTAWKLAADLGYFAGAGVISLFAWAILRGILKSRGIEIDLPGETIKPPPLGTAQKAPASSVTDEPADSGNSEDA